MIDVLPRRLPAARLFLICTAVLVGTARGGEGPRLSAMPTAQMSAPGHGPLLAVDGDAATLWIANLKPNRRNNRVWFQLDLGRVKAVARLHWSAATGSPYPASAPKKYRVRLSRDGRRWTTAVSVTARGANEPIGNLLLNGQARYVRLETGQVNDGSGWSLGLREIWVTGGRDDSAARRQLRPRAVAGDGLIRLTWKTPPVNSSRLRLYRALAPGSAGTVLVSGPAEPGHFTDHVKNWVPHYYRLEALDAGGQRLLISDNTAAFARSRQPVTGRVETFAFWYEPYKPTTDSDASIRHIGHGSFVVGPGAGAAADLAKAGMGLLPYVTLYQTSRWAGTFPSTADPRAVAKKIAPIAFYQPGLHYTHAPRGYLPTVFCRPGNVEYNPRAIQYTTCPNSAPFRDMVRAHVRKQLAGGVVGFFVDNGYRDDIAARSVCRSTLHAHYYGNDLTSADAFLGLLMEMTCAVKKRNPRGVVMVNGGVAPGAEFGGLKLGDVSDGLLWESYLRSSYSTRDKHVYNWRSVYKRSVDLEKAWYASPPERMFVLSYPWDRGEAFFCYATAKLCNLPWSAGLGISDSDHSRFGGHFGTYPELIALRLGKPTRQRRYGGGRIGAVYLRFYEHGLVMVNPTKRPQPLAVRLDRVRSYRDLYGRTDGSGRVITNTLPSESGRVYLWK